MATYTLFKLTILATLVGVLNPAIATSIPVVPMQLTDGCSTNSLATPDWLVHNYTSVGFMKSFSVLNRATNTSEEVVCPNPGPGGPGRCAATASWSGLSVMEVVQSSDGTSVRIGLSQTWTCNDVKPLKFVAFGNGSLPLTCTGDTCKSATAAPSLIKAVLRSPISITPAYTNGPTGHDNQGCTALSKTPTWELTLSQFSRRTSYNGNEATTSGNAFMVVTNRETGSSSSCFLERYSREPGPQVMDCSEQTPYGPREKYRIKTEASFDPANFAFSVNETWYCDDLDPTAPAAFKGVSNVNINSSIECQEFPVEGSRDLTVFCTGGGLVWNGTLVGQEKLPPYALKDPKPTADSCTVSSILSPAWRMGNLAVNTNANGTSGSITLQLELQASDSPGQYPTTIIQSWNKLTESTEPEWYQCGFPEGEQPEHLTRCSFQYSAASKSLALNASWTCRDLDKEQPIFFTGIANTTLPDLTCAPTGVANETRCATPRGKAWTASIGSVAWSQPSWGVASS